MTPVELGGGRRRRAVFLDKDGTLVEHVAPEADPTQARFMPNVLEGLRSLADAGLPLFVLANEPGLATGRITRPGLVQAQHLIEQRLYDEGGVRLAGWYTCRHSVDANCLCRIPSPGLLRQGALAHGVDLGRSWMIGDILDDIEAGRRAGCTTVLIDVGNETAWRKSPLRQPHHRCTDFMEAAELILDQYEHRL